MPHLPRHAGRAAGPQQARGRVRAASRRGAGLHDTSPIDLRPQELLLSRPSEGISDLHVRPAAHGRRAPRHRRERRAQGDRDHAHPHGGGRREAPARGVPRLESKVVRRLQPLRRAAHRDRERARPALAGGGARLLLDAAHHPGLHRHHRRQHGGGIPALRCERFAAAERAESLRHQGRAQEPQLLQVRGARSRARNRQADGDPRFGRPREPGDAPLRPEAGPHLPDAVEGGGARLPLLSRAGSPAARASWRWASRTRARRC